MQHVFLCAALAGAIAGCQGNGGAALGLSSEPAQALPSMKVELPPAPSFAEPDLPLAYPDGTMSVYGLRKQLDKYISKDVKVKAYLLELYECPKCPKGQTCKLCSQPHFFLSDTANGKKEKSLMVVDYLMPKQKPPALTLGKQYEVQGTFARNSPTGFAASDGLLLFTRMLDDKNVEFVSSAAQLEAKALAGEAKESADLARAAKMKKAQLKE
jgi:hypothetical protein